MSEYQGKYTHEAGTPEHDQAWLYRRAIGRTKLDIAALEANEPAADGTPRARLVWESRMQVLKSKAAYLQAQLDELAAFGEVAA